jgi:hypothetical protein
MVSWIYAHYLEINSKVEELWLPYTGKNKGNEPGGKTHYTNPEGATSSFGRSLKSSKEGSELRKLVQGFTAGAHLVNDVEPANLNAERKTSDLAQTTTKHKFVKTPGIYHLLVLSVSYPDFLTLFFLPIYNQNITQMEYQRALLFSWQLQHWL